MKHDCEAASPSHSSARGHWLLLAGAGTGLVLAAAGILRPAVEKVPPLSVEVPRPAMGIEPLPPDVVARVNDRFITAQEFAQVVALDAAEGDVMNEEGKRRVLDRMIDEELRVQRGIDLNLHLSDSRVRMDIASAIAEAAVAAAERTPPDDAALRAHFEKKRTFFAERGPLRVQHIWVAILGGNLGEAFTRARTAATMLREKEAFGVVKEITGNSHARPIPDRFLSPEELQGYIGGEALNIVLRLRAGEVSEPVRTNDGFHVVKLLERRRRAALSFEECRADVEADFGAERMQLVLEASAAELRESARVQKVDSLP